MTGIDDALANLPDELSQSLIKHYLKIKDNYALGKYEPSELNGAKFCEVVVRILQWHATGNYTPLGQQFPKPFDQAIRQFESLTTFPDSIRFHIPHVLHALYPIRNKRGVAHAAGEIDSNRMDATFVVGCANWIMAELVRLFSNVEPEQAQSIIETITTKEIPTIWQVGNIRRVIVPTGRKLTAREKVLLLLYHTHPSSLSSDTLLSWTEYGNKTRFRDSVLKRLHAEDLVHYDGRKDEVYLSPLGLQYVEKNLPLTVE